MNASVDDTHTGDYKQMTATYLGLPEIFKAKTMVRRNVFRHITPNIF
jgi:hypothetical protein